MKDILDRLRDVDHRVRKEAVQSLKDVKNEEAITLLVEALGDEDASVSKEAIQILQQHGDESIPHMIKALKHTSWSVRRNAAGVLVGMGNTFLEMLMDLARTNDDDIQFWILEVVSQFGAKAVHTLTDILENENMPKRLCALSALGKTGVSEAVDPLIKALSDPQWTIRKTAAIALVQLGRVAVPGVAELMNHESDDLVFWAIQILGQIGGEQSKKIIVQKALNDETTVDQKQVLIQSLGNFVDPEVVPPLIQMLGDEHWIIRKLAAEALWELGDISQEELFKALKSKNDHLRYWACKVLGDIQAKHSVKVLTEIMKNDATWSVRAAAASALGEIGEEASTLDLVDALRDSSEYVRKNAMIALNKLGEVKEMQSKITNEWVQDYTKSVFNDLKSKKSRSITTRLRQLIHDVPDFPKPGIIFKDITPLLMAPHGISDVTKLFEGYLKGRKIDVVAGIESRGFLLGAALAQSLKTSFIPVRKKGKLPGKCLDVSYDLEYGSAELEVQVDHLKGKNVIIVDDVLATGGTAAACAQLVEKAEGKVCGFLFLIELDFLNGREKLGDHRTDSILHY